jgi:sugar lactone lactonase YvrE
MARRHLIALLVIIGAGLTYGYVHLSSAPIQITPVSWESPPNSGLTGIFSPNGMLTKAQLIKLGDHEGPEAIAFTQDGRLITGTSDGHILRIDPRTGDVESMGNTGGRPLGLTMDSKGNLYIADAIKGLLLRTPDGSFKPLCQTVERLRVGFADDVTVSRAGMLYFTDASTRFSPAEYGGPYEASRLEIVEHEGTGRVIECDPITGESRVLAKGLVLANGITLTHDERALLIVETGAYAVRRHWLSGPRAGRTLQFVEGLPGFPDNISRGRDGRYWIGLVSPRNMLLDALSESPGARAVIQRLPRWMQPDAKAFGHIVAIDGSGEVVASLQDPTGRVGFTVGVHETREQLYISRLRGDAIAVVPNGVQSAK